jgi:hypothetical protein
MKLLASLDPKDRRMLLLILGLVAALMILLAVLSPSQDESRNTTPASYLSGRHGAKAAFTLLGQRGYQIDRWEEPLGILAERANTSTVLILAEPYSFEEEDRNAVREILQKGGRVLATGLQGGVLLPGNAITRASDLSFADCEAQPQGLSPIAADGTIWIAARAGWKSAGPQYRTDYDCAGSPVVVEYAYAKGHIVWWAGSTPLENASITRSHNLDLLLNSIGPPAGHHIYWDESLHGQVYTPWDFTSGPVASLLLYGSLGIALLTILSFSRRSGPIRPLPVLARTTPIEFIDALGGLYRSAGAAPTAVQIAWERFRVAATRLSGQRNHKIDARELAAALERRFGSAATGMEADLIAAEDACTDDTLKPRKALAIVRSLRHHEETLRSLTTRSGRLSA